VVLDGAGALHPEMRFERLGQGAFHDGCHTSVMDGIERVRRPRAVRQPSNQDHISGTQTLAVLQRRGTGQLYIAEPVLLEHERQCLRPVGALFLLVQRTSVLVTAVHEQHA
jgi:hypothetical protein